MTAFADSQIQYVDLDGVWGEYRLFVGGKDVTDFRGKRAQVSNYQLTEPYAFGPADFNLPALTQFEVDAWGAGDLAWMGNGKPVVLKQVRDGVVVRTVWRGFVSLPRATATGTLLHCDGEASGRLALRVKLPPLFFLKSHIGRRIYDAFNKVHLNITPYLGGDIGVLVDGRGMTGSMLDYVDGLLAGTIGTGGAQYTVSHVDTGGYHLGLKDTTTTDFTVFLGAHGVDVDLGDDLTERPNTIYGQGIAPSGLVWVNGKYPGLKQGEAPPYPMTDDSAFGAGTVDGDTDTGDGVTLMINRLTGMAYLDRRDQPGGFDADVTAAIKDLQDDAGLTQSGNMNTATWDALFDLGVTGFSLRRAAPMPLAQDPRVKKWNRTGSGALLSRNPAYDPSILEVDLAVDHGTGVDKSRARAYSRGVLARAQNEQNWAGTITLTSDVFAGSHVHGDVDPATMSRLDIKAGMNVTVRGFDGNTKLHVAIVNVNSDLSVTLGVDTQARDAATLGEVIARNIESRSHPARLWRRQRRTDANTRFVEFSEVGGKVFDKVTCPGGQWTVFPVIAGQAGSVSRVRIQTEDAHAAFCVAIFGQKVGHGWLGQHVGNPLVNNDDGTSKWSNASVQNFLDNRRVLLGAWGDHDQPCGYFPKAHTGPDGNVTGAPITGLFLEDAGFDYHTFGDPVLYVCVYPDRDTVIRPQRILWETLEGNV